MKNLNLLEACSIMGDALALRMGIGFQQGSNIKLNAPKDWLFFKPTPHFLSVFFLAIITSDIKSANSGFCRAKARLAAHHTVPLGPDGLGNSKGDGTGCREGL